MKILSTRCWNATIKATRGYRNTFLSFVQVPSNSTYLFVCLFVCPNFRSAIKKVAQLLLQLKDFVKAEAVTSEHGVSLWRASGWRRLSDDRPTDYRLPAHNTPTAADDNRLVTEHVPTTINRTGISTLDQCAEEALRVFFCCSSSPLKESVWTARSTENFRQDLAVKQNSSFWVTTCRPQGGRGAERVATTCRALPKVAHGFQWTVPEEPHVIMLKQHHWSILHVALTTVKKHVCIPRDVWEECAFPWQQRFTEV